MRRPVTRRQLIKATGVAGVTTLAGCTGGPESTPTDSPTDSPAGGDTDTPGETPTTDTPAPSIPSGSLKIGVLQPLSGPLIYYGQQSMWGMYSGFAYKGETSPIGEAKTGTETMAVGDLDIEFLVRDTELSPDKAQNIATDLVQNEGVDFLWGVTSSASAERVIKNVAKPSNTPILVGPAASSSITASSENCGKHVFRTNENTAMDARSGGNYVANETDVSSVYLVGADYSFGHAVVNNYETVLKANGVDIAGKKFVNRGYSEFKGILDNAQSLGADGLVPGFTAATLPALITTFVNGDYDMRLFGGFATELTNGIVGATLEKSLGDLTKKKIQNQQFGPFTTRYHWNQYDNPVNDAFVTMHIDSYGKVPDLFSSGQFTAASALVQGAAESGSTDPIEIANRMRGMSVRETPKGENGYVFQDYNNQARSEMTIAKVVPTTDFWSANWGSSIMPSAPVARVSKDVVTIPKDSSEMGCSL